MNNSTITYESKWIIGSFLFSLFILLCMFILLPFHASADTYPNPSGPNGGFKLTDGITGGQFQLYGNAANGFKKECTLGFNCPGEGLYERHTYLKVVGRTLNIQNSTTTVTIVDACKIVKDGIGWQDHGYDPSTSNGEHNVRDIEAVAERVDASNGGYGSSGIQVGSIARCSGNNDNLTLNLTSNDFKNSNGSFEDPHFGTGISSVIIDIAKCDYSGPVKNCGGGLVGEKVFTVQTTANVSPTFVDIAPNQPGDQPGSTYNAGNPIDYSGAIGDNLNMQNPAADYGFDGTHELPGPESTYTFSFTPDCTYNPNSDVWLKWANAGGSPDTQPNNDEQWTLTGGNQLLSHYTQGDGPALNKQDIGKLQIGTSYTWTWYGVDRAHGIVIWLPFSEFTGGSCPRPTGRILAVNPTCDEMTLYAFDTSEWSTRVNFEVYHKNIGFGTTRDFASTVGQPAQGFGNPNQPSVGTALKAAYAAHGNDPTFYLRMQDPVDQQWYWVNAGSMNPVLSTNTNSPPADAGVNYPEPCTSPQSNATCDGIQFNTPAATPAGHSTYYAVYTNYNGASGDPNMPYVVGGAVGAGIYPGDPSGSTSGDRLASGSGAAAGPIGYSMVREGKITTQKPLHYTVVMYTKFSFGSFNGFEVNNIISGTTPGNCYTAHCNVQVNPFDSPWGFGSPDVKAGQTIRITFTIYNDGINTIWDDMTTAFGGPGYKLTGALQLNPPGTTHPWALPNPPNLGWANYGFIYMDDSSLSSPPGIPPGENSNPFLTGTFTEVVPADTDVHNIIMTPAYYGFSGGSLGPACQTSVNAFEQFGSTPNTSATLYRGNTPNSENPDHVVKSYQATYTGVPPPPQIINEELLYPSPTGGSIETEGGPGTFSYGPLAAGPGGNPHTPAAGDQYCAVMTISPASGWVGPPGTTPHDTSDASDGPHCATVVNEPYLKVYGSGVSSGCNGSGGLLASWNDDSGMNPSTDPNSGVGAGAQLSALALGNIAGFASGQATASFLAAPPRGTSLTFANTVPGTNTQMYSQDTPNMGGQFGGSSCPSTVIKPIDNLKPFSSSAPLDTLDGNYVPNGPTTINGGQIGIGNHVEIFVTGDVYISNNNITYAGKNGGWSWNATTKNIPSFELVADGGNIYIDPNVTELDGLYVAQLRGGNGGKIYTCATGIGSQIPATNLYSQCNKQLTVIGSFVANQVNLMRTYGSLRDSIPNPNEYPTTPSLNRCDNNPGGAIYPNICAAEVFDFSPEMYLASPSSTSNGGLIKYQTFTSLPPVL